MTEGLAWEAIATDSSASLVTGVLGAVNAGWTCAAIWVRVVIVLAGLVAMVVRSV